MRRLLLVLTVALVMAAMVVATAAPAFARNATYGHCVGGQGSQDTRKLNPSNNNLSTITCTK